MNINTITRLAHGEWRDFTDIGERLARSYLRNREGWETWLALQADVAAERTAKR